MNADSLVTLQSGAAAQFLVTGSEAYNYISPTATIILAISTALVLLMVPGLAFFYGGLVRRKNVATIMAQCFISTAIVAAIWIFGGFGLAFGSDTRGGFIGNIANYVFFKNILFTKGWTDLGMVVNISIANGVPFVLFFLFQLAFAIITPALVVGAFADRLSWKGYILFNILFTIFIYIPVCHWIWGGGFLETAGVIDWAGGIVIHATCGLAAIASVVVLGKRTILKKENTAPSSLALVSIGAGILFFGWFGFNVGGATYSVLPSNITTTHEALSYLQNSATAIANFKQSMDVALNVGVTAFVNSFLGMMSAMLMWMSLDFAFNKGKTSFTSILTAGVAGLATITPAAGYVPMWAGLVFGLVGGFVTYLMCKLNHHTHFDDALEVWPVHGIGGIVGGLLLGAFATTKVNPNILGSTQHIGASLGSGYLFGVQVGAIALVCAWTFVFGLIIFAITIFTKDKVSVAKQIEGLDKVYFNEATYPEEINEEAVALGVGNEIAGHEHHNKEHSLKILCFKKKLQEREILKK